MVRLEESSDNDTSVNLSTHDDSANGEGALDASIDPYYPPIVSLPEVDVPTGEDDEAEIFKIRSKLFRFDSNESPPEWKERGTGDVRLLQHKESKIIRLLMRREKTLRICANHFIRPWMILKPMKGSDRAFTWQVHADFAEEQIKTEVLAIRFANAENATKFKTAFDSAVMTVTETEAMKINLEEGNITNESKEKDSQNESISKDTKAAQSPKTKSDEITEDLQQLSVKEN